MRGGKTPDLPLDDAERMGYVIAILPGLLLGSILTACDEALEAVKRERRFPTPKVETSPAKTFARFGSAQWDERRTAFRDPIEPVTAQAVSAAVTAK